MKFQLFLCFKEEFNKLLAPLCPDQSVQTAKQLVFWTLFIAIVPKLVTLEIELSNQTERTLYFILNVLLEVKKEVRRNPQGSFSCQESFICYNLQGLFGQ